MKTKAMRSVRTRWRFLALLAGCLVVLLAATACAGIRLPRYRAASPSEATPAPQASPAPEAEASDARIAAALLLDGRPYRREPLPDGATLFFEPWVDYGAVLGVVEVYSKTRSVIEQMLGVADLAAPEIYVVLPGQFNKFAGAGEFTNPSWLAGISSYVMREGRVAEGKVYVNVTATGLSRNVAHELTHLATPDVPTWLSEGVAEYVASSVQLDFDSEGHRFRWLDARGAVRRAISKGALMDLKALEEFPWKASEDFKALDLAYAETWLLVEHIVRNASVASVQGLMALYQKGSQDKGADPFPETVGITEAELWQDLSADILQNLEPEELEGIGLCSLAGLANDATAISKEWNQFLALIDQARADYSVQKFQGFRQRWETLAGQTRQVAPLGQAVAIHELTLSYTEAMVQVMDRFSSGRTDAGNRLMITANQRFSLVVELLRQAFTQRRWLACG